MAILVPHRPRYRNRTQPIYYLLGERACLRSRPKQVHDPKTPAQLMQRLRMRVASHFLTQFRGIVELGYAPERQENYRQVGAYQLALGQLMRTALVPHADGVAIDTARVQLSEGRGNPMQSATGTVAGGVLRIRWTGQLPKRCELLLVGLWNRQKGEARSLRLEGQDYGGGLGIPIPARVGGRHARRVGGPLAPRAARAFRFAARRGVGAHGPRRGGAAPAPWAHGRSGAPSVPEAIAQLREDPQPHQGGRLLLGGPAAERMRGVDVLRPLQNACKLV